jgi:hypothetical protein
MNELDQFEADLRRLTPAPLPEALQTRLGAARPRPRAVSPPSAERLPVWLRWLFPLAATTGLAGWLALQLASPRPLPVAVDAAITADEVQIGQTLVGSFDTIARLPDGMPVRLRYEHWVDEWTFRDSARGISVAQSWPRVEIIPVRLETY